MELTVLQEIQAPDGGFTLVPVRVPVPEGEHIEQLWPHVGTVHLPGLGVTLAPGAYWHFPEGHESPLFRRVADEDVAALAEPDGGLVSPAVQREDPVTGLLPEDLAANPYAPHDALPEEDA